VRTLSRESLIRFCHLDYDRELALVAVSLDADRSPHIVGVSRYYLNAGTGAAEFALVVTDDWQGHGLGRHLMQRLISAAPERGVRQLDGQVLRDNRAMLELVQGLGFVIEPTDDVTVVSATLDLAAAAATGPG
jgi:acetyltransferase